MPLMTDATCPPLPWPDGHRRVLLHSCCAPCSSAIIEAMLASSIEVTVFFYNPNIHPRAEYARRKDEQMRFLERLGVPFMEADYEPDAWCARTQGLEHEPERGRRCTLCFDMRLEVTADRANAHGFPVIATSLGISRWKDQQQVNACGRRAAARYPGLIYWDYNWRKAGGSERMAAISRREHFYRQEYCGCVYSLRDANARRRALGRDHIQVG
ncbi:MAG: epoxyqueuosine reductase QueH [Thermochromatium sp.]